MLSDVRKFTTRSHLKKVCSSFMALSDGNNCYDFIVALLNTLVLVKLLQFENLRYRSLICVVNIKNYGGSLLLVLKISVRISIK